MAADRCWHCNKVLQYSEIAKDDVCFKCKQSDRCSSTKDTVCTD